MFKPCPEFPIPRQAIRLLLVTVALLAGALRSAHAEPEVAMRADPELWVLLPCNVEEVPPEYMVDGAVTLDNVLAAELARRELGFIQLSLVDGLRRWTRATNTVGGLVYSLTGIEQESVERARQEFVESLLKEYDATGVIWPDVRERKAVQRRNKLVWDGVSRQIPGSSDAKRYRLPAMGSSLRIRVFGAESKLISDEHIGLEAIHRFELVPVRVSGIPSGHRGFTHVRANLFEDRKLLHETVRRMLPDEHQ